MTNRSPPKPGAWRRVRIVAAFVFAGFVTSVVVAWSIEVARAFRYRNVTGAAPAPRQLGHRSEPVAGQPDKALVFIKTREPGITGWSQVLFDANVGIRSPVLPSVPYWAERSFELGADGCNTLAYGFPVPCMTRWYQYEMVRPGVKATRRLTNSGRLKLEIPSQRLCVQIPLVPLPVGLCVNTLIFAALWSVPCMPRAIRRYRAMCREGRGCCPHCNYDLRGDFSRVCSECGRMTKPRATTETPP